MSRFEITDSIQTIVVISARRAGTSTPEVNINKFRALEINQSNIAWKILFYIFRVTILNTFGTK